MHPQTNKVPENAIAVIGMDCRFPGANDTRQFWKNLVSGTESITFSRTTNCAGQASIRRP